MWAGSPEGIPVPNKPFWGVTSPTLENFQTCLGSTWNTQGKGAWRPRGSDGTHSSMEFHKSFCQSCISPCSGSGNRPCLFLNTAGINMQRASAEIVAPQMPFCEAFQGAFLEHCPPGQCIHVSQPMCLEDTMSPPLDGGQLWGQSSAGPLALPALPIPAGPAQLEEGRNLSSLGCC